MRRGEAQINAERSRHPCRLGPRLKHGAIEQALACLGQDPDVQSLVLFGSRARGDARVDSDLDLLILVGELLTPERERQLHRRARAILRLALHHEHSLAAGLAARARSLCRDVAGRKPIARAGVADGDRGCRRGSGSGSFGGAGFGGRAEAIGRLGHAACRWA